MRAGQRSGTLTRFLVGLAVVGCGGEQGAGPIEPARGDLHIAIVSGDGQQDLVGTSLSDFLVVRVSFGPGEPAEGVVVEWTVLEGGGVLSRKGPRTDREGLAAAALFLGEEPGEQVIRAALESGPEVLFTARALRPESPPIREGRPAAAATRDPSGP